MAKVKVEDKDIKKQTMREIKKASKANKKTLKEEKTDTIKTKKRKHLEPSKIAAIVIVSIIVATMLFGACATLIFYLQYYA